MKPYILPVLRCLRCAHAWTPRGDGTPPLTCPKCRSPYWNRPRPSAVANTDGDE